MYIIYHTHTNIFDGEGFTQQNSNNTTHVAVGITAVSTINISAINEVRVGRPKLAARGSQPEANGKKGRQREAEKQQTR